MAASSGDAETPSRFDPFGPNAEADATRQAQQRIANDAIADVALNDVVAREQALTFTVAGQSFAANSDLRQKYADKNFGKMA